MLGKLVQTSADPSALIARLVLGVGHAPPRRAEDARLVRRLRLLRHPGVLPRLGLPDVLALLVIFAEFFGSLGLITGLLGRVAAFGVGAVMTGAILTVHLPNGFFMNWTGQQAGEGFEYHLLVLAMVVTLMIKGGGLWFVDALVSRRISR